MKTIAAMSVLLLGSFAGATEAKFTFSMASQPAGTATLSSNNLPDGGSQFIVDLHIDYPGQTIHQRQEDSYDKDGKPTISTSLVEQGTNKTVIKVVYGYASLTATTTVNDKKTEKFVRFPIGKSIVKPSQLWFFSVRPEKGKVSKELDYDPRAGAWVNHQRVYVGTSRLTIGGKQVTAFEIDDKNLSDGTVVKQMVDEHGMPYRVDFGSTDSPMSMERVAK